MNPVDEAKKILGQFVVESRYLYCFIVDQEGCVFYSNAAFNRFFQTNKKELESAPLTTLFAPESANEIEDIVTRVLESETYHNDHWIITTKSGSSHHVILETKRISISEKSYAVGIIQDITTEKRLETEVKKQQKELLAKVKQSNLFIETSKIGTFVSDLESETFEFNDILLEQYELNREDVSGPQIWLDRIHPDDLLKVRTHGDLLLDGNGYNNLEFRIITPSGEIKYLQSSGLSIKNENGKIIKLLGANIDITAQKLNEQANEASRIQLEQYSRLVQLKNEQLELAVSTAELGLWSYQVTKDSLAWNERQFELFEMTPEEFQQDQYSFQKYMHPDDLALTPDHIQQVINKETIPGHIYRIVTKSGKTKHILGSIAPIIGENGEVDEIHGVNIDISLLMETQREIEERTQQLANVADTVPGVVQQYILKPDGTDDIRYMSKGVEALYGIPYETARNNVKSIWALVMEEDVAGLAESIQASAKDLSLWEHSYRIKTPQGKVKYLHGNAVPQKEDDGTIVWDVIIQDISQQVEQDRALAKQRDMLSKLSNQVPGIVYIYQIFPDGIDNFFYISDGVQDVFEVDADSVMDDTSLIWGQIFEEDLVTVQQTVANSTQRMEQWEATFRIKTPSGIIKHIRATGTPHKLEDGTIQWYSMASDISSLIEQQDEIRKQQAQIQQIANQIPGVIVRIYFDPDQNGTVEYVSHGVTEMFGLSQQEVLNDLGALLKRHHEDDLEEILDSMAKAADKEKKWEHIHRYYGPDGEIRHMQAFGTPMKLENGGLIWNIITLDITERIEAEHRATTTSTKLRAFINASPIAIYQINSEGIVTDFWNPSAELIFGWEHDKVIGKIVPFITPENHDSFMEIITDIQNTSRPKQFPFAIINRFGEHLQLDITAGPIFDENGKLTDLLIIANDVTELEDYRRTIEKALREKEILLQEIHHRVKNNLAIVSGLLELQAMRNDSGKDLSLIIEARNRIHSIAMVHEQLYRDMDFSHINPRDYYKKLLSKLQANTVSEDRDIDYDLKFEIDRININQAVPLGLLINELFTNSVKYAFNDGHGKLTLHFLKENEAISVHYADNGPGFNVDEIKGKNTIGWQLIVTLLAQLDSEYTIDTDGKFDLKFSFKEVTRGSQTNLP